MRGPAVDATLPCRRCKIKPVVFGAAPSPVAPLQAQEPAW
jgi:hypothetical protein